MLETKVDAVNPTWSLTNDCLGSRNRFETAKSKGVIVCCPLCAVSTQYNSGTTAGEWSRQQCL
jgi:hypothetical protein